MYSQACNGGLKPSNLTHLLITSPDLTTQCIQIIKNLDYNLLNMHYRSPLNIFCLYKNRCAPLFPSHYFFLSTENMLFYSSSSLLGGCCFWVTYLVASPVFCYSLSCAVLLFTQASCTSPSSSNPSAPLYRRQPRNMCCRVRLHF